LYMRVFWLDGCVEVQVPQIAQLQVKTDLNELVQVLAWFDRLYKPEISDSFWQQCQLALAEGFTNAVRHAHKGRTSDVPIDLEVKVSSESVEIRIWDYGPPFDLSQTLRDLPPKIDENAEGGRGLKIMQDMTDYLSYVRTDDDRNCLLLVKNYNGEAGFNHRSITRFS
jgi:serine/threonine-protein kinase RsbW